VEVRPDRRTTLGLRWLVNYSRLRGEKTMEQAGFVFSGTTPDGRLVEIIEIKEHPWFVASQFHPEFTSRPTRPQPLFRDFVRASLTAAEKM
jgi:CTP synthase